MLRQETPEPSVYPQQAPGLDVEIEIQWRAMSGLAGAAKLPLAPLVGFERDPSVLGAPFFVMGFVDGPGAVGEPALHDARDSSQRRRPTSVGGCSRTASPCWRASTPWTGSAPASTGSSRRAPAPGTLAQLALWERYADRELAGREHPVLARGLAWLHAHPPPESKLALSLGRRAPGQHDLAATSAASASPTSRTWRSRSPSSTSAGG